MKLFHVWTGWPEVLVQKATDYFFRNGITPVVLKLQNRYALVARSYIGSTVEPHSHLGRFGYPIASIFHVVWSFGCLVMIRKCHFHR